MTLGIGLGVGIASVGRNRTAQWPPAGLLQLALLTGEQAQVVEGLRVLETLLQLQQGFEQWPGFIEPALLQEWPDGDHGRCSAVVGSARRTIR